MKDFKKIGETYFFLNVSLTTAHVSKTEPNPHHNKTWDPDPSFTIMNAPSSTSTTTIVIHIGPGGDPSRLPQGVCGALGRDRPPPTPFCP